MMNIKVIGFLLSQNHAKSRYFQSIFKIALHGKYF